MLNYISNKENYLDPNNSNSNSDYNHNNDGYSTSHHNSSQALHESIWRHPTLADYYINLTPFITLSMMLAFLLTLFSFLIFCTTVLQLQKKSNRRLLPPSIALCSLYPLISCAAFITILLPKSWLICHTAMHMSFTFGAVIYQKLCFGYIDANPHHDTDAGMVRKLSSMTIALNTPPLCCCCACLPTPLSSKARLNCLHIMIWQMPFVQGTIMLLLNIIYYSRQEDLYNDLQIYFIPSIVCSILLGIWALNIIMRLVGSIRTDCALTKKMFCLQLILLLCKLQYMLLNSQLNGVPLGGAYPMNHTIYKQTTINLLILIEMVLVSTLVQNAYKLPNDKLNAINVKP